MSVMSALGSPFGDVSLVDESRWSAMLVLPFAVHSPGNGPTAWVWVLLAGCSGPGDSPLLYPADMHTLPERPVGAMAPRNPGRNVPHCRPAPGSPASPGLRGR